MAKLPATLSEMVSLPPPRNSWVPRTRAPGSYQAAKHFLRRWKDLLLTPPTDEAEVQYTCQACGKSHQLRGREVWGRQFLVAGGYYDFAVRRLLSLRADQEKYFPPGLNYLANSDKVLGAVNQDDPALEVAQGAFIIHHYLLALLSLYFTRTFRNLPLGNLPTPLFERSAHEAFSGLSELSATAALPQMRSCARMLLDGLLTLGTEVYSDESTWNKDHKIGPFSSIRLPELALLAKREQSIIDRYGQHHVDKVFEQQLALVMQSFGFVVVQTRRGERTVDLVCISGDPREPLTLLVEAKTTGRPYSLPVDDQRALIEYADDVRRNLSTLPPLKLVLIVGPRSSNNLEERLAAVEQDLGVPTRFIPAQELADLREVLPGPLPLSAFFTMSVSSRTRILGEIAEPISRVQQTVTGAHSHLVKTLLDGGRPDAVTDAAWDPASGAC